MKNRRLFESVNGGAMLIVRNLGYVEVDVDDYNGGESDFVNNWDFDIRGEYATAQELVDAIANVTGCFTNNVDDYIVDSEQHCIQTDATVDEDNDIPSDRDIEAWKQGKKTLYVAHLWLDVEVGMTLHGITEKDAEMFGFTEMY